MRTLAILLTSLAFSAACTEPDPRVAAAEDFRSTAFELIEQDEEQAERLAGLRTGMSEAEVLASVGPPSTRASSTSSESDGSEETWTYVGQLKTLGTLTLENQRLARIEVY